MPVDPHASVRISAFMWVPPFAKGHVRDLRRAGRSRKPAFPMPCESSMPRQNARPTTSRNSRSARCRAIATTAHPYDLMPGHPLPQ